MGRLALTIAFLPQVYILVGVMQSVKVLFPQCGSAINKTLRVMCLLSDPRDKSPVTDLTGDLTGFRVGCRWWISCLFLLHVLFFFFH